MQEQQDNWDSVPEYGTEGVQQTVQEESIENAEQVEDPQKVEEEAKVDWQKRYKDLEPSHSRRGNQIHGLEQEVDRVKLQILEESQKRMDAELKANEVSKTAKQDEVKEKEEEQKAKYFDEEYQQFVTDYPDIEKNLAKRLEFEVNKKESNIKRSYREAIKEEEEKRKSLEKKIDELQGFQSQNAFDSYMVGNVGKDWQDIGHDEKFMSYVNSATYRIKSMKSGDAVQMSEVMNDWLGVTEDGRSYRGDSQPQTNDQKRTAVQGLVGNSEPKVSSTPRPTSGAEAWDSIPEYYAEDGSVNT